MLLSHLTGKTCPDVSAQSHIEAGRLQDMIDQTRGGCFAVTPRDANHFGIGVASGKFYLAHHMNAASCHFLHDRSAIGYARTFYYFLCCQDNFFGMFSFLEINMIIDKRLSMLVVKLSAIRQKHVESLGFSQNGCPYSAFATTQNN
jgi:hypothetical protein